MTSFYEEAKRKGFNNGREYYLWLLENKKIKSHSEVNNEYARRIGFKNQTEYRKYCANMRGFKDDIERQESWAKNRGYKDINEYNREKVWNRGYQSPMSENLDCSNHLGIYIGERNIAKEVLSMIFEKIENMRCNNSGFDFICKNPIEEFIENRPIFNFAKEGEYKINVKCRRLSDNSYNYNKWNFPIRYNDISDYFLLIGFNGEYDDNKLEPLFAWLFRKNEIIRGRKFCEFGGFGITNNPYYLEWLRAYELKNELRRLKLYRSTQSDNRI